MLTVLLIIIYISFISLGLPDSILGSAWPIVHLDLNVPTYYAGLVTMIISGGTIISSFFSGKLIRRFGTGKILTVSVSMTAAALLGISIVPHFFWICLLGIPLGMGAGAVDSALNNFVSLHYKAKHMNWLHSFWGIGATTGPFIMSLFLLRENGWRWGYSVIGFIQTGLVLSLILSLPLWQKFETSKEEETVEQMELKFNSLLKLPGAKPALIGFFSYCAIELTTGFWGSSYLVLQKGIEPEIAAKWISFFYLGITTGRFLSGFLTMKFNNRVMIRIGQMIILCGLILLLIPFSNYFQMAGLIFIGLGCAPIYPAMLHETPNRFGKEVSQAIMGLQMSVAYIGSTIMPPIFGVLATTVGFQILPVYLLVLILIMIYGTELVNQVMSKNKQKQVKI